MNYSYHSNGRISRSISDYRDTVISDLSNHQLHKWWEEQIQTIKIEETSVAANNYGNISQYGSYGIGSRTKGTGYGADNQVATGGILIVGERGPLHVSGSAVAFPVLRPNTNIYCGGGICIYSYEAGNRSETVGQHGPSVINAGIGARRIDSFQFIFDTWQSISRFTGAAECRAYIYEPDVFEDYLELDYGLINSNAGSNVDNGSITQLNGVTLEDRGHILHTGERRRFGFVKVVGEAQAKATNAWVGEGRLIAFSKQAAANIYGWITDGKVRISGLASAEGTFSPSSYGGGNIPLRGIIQESFTPATSIGSGLFSTISGAAESATWNPDEKQLLFSFAGGLTSEKHTEVYTGSGLLYNLSGASECISLAKEGIGLYRITGDSHDTRARVFVGSGSLKKFSGAAESLTFNPTEEQILFSIHGIVTEKHTESYVGSGRIRKLSGAAESIRWAAQHTTGLYRITGDSYDTRARAFSGSGTFKKFSGAAESLTFNPIERRLLFSFTNGAVHSSTDIYIGSGRLRNFSKIEAEKQSFDYIGSGSFRLDPRKPQEYKLSMLGNFTLDHYTLVSSYINLGYLTRYDQANTNLAPVQLWYLNREEGHEKHTEAYNNSACEDGIALDYGNLVNNSLLNCVANSGTISTNTTATSGCIKVAPGTTLAITPGSTYTVPNQIATPTSSEDYGLVSNPNAPENRDYGHILDSLSKVCPFGAFNITGTAKTHFVENIVSTSISVSGRATLNLSGAANTFWTPPYHADGLGRITGSGHESFTPAPEIGDGILFSMGGGAESIANVEKADGLFRIGGAVFPLFSLLHPGSGTIRVLGTGRESITPATHVGSGSLKKFSGAAESATWNPLERQLLFSFTGEGTETFTANPPEEGTEIRLFGTAAPFFFIPRYPGYGVIKVTGDGIFATANSFIGSGSFKKFSGAAESITFNPLEKQLLFSFAGSGTEKVTLNPPEEGTNIRLRGEGVYTLDSSYAGSGRIVISGEAVSKTTKPFIGSGSLKKFSGAAESITFNPLEKQLLFSFTGKGTENTTTTEIGSGRLFTVSGATATSAAAFESTGLFRVSGISTNNRSTSQIGSGTFKKFSGAAESITVNPDERQMLFSFTGTSSSSLGRAESGSGSISIYPEASDYRFTPNWNSVGGVRIEIQSVYRFAPVWIGSGSLKKFSGAAESITFNPEEKQLLFSFTGTGSESTTTKTNVKGGTVRLDGTPRVRWVPNNIGSGTIFLSGTAKTHYVPDVEGSGVLYNFAGAAESVSVDITSIPTLFRVYGDGNVSRTRPYTGSGSLRKLGGSAESLTVNPDEKQMLFSFLGQGATTRARSKSGQGTVRTLGDSTVRFSPVYFGSGTTRVSGEVYVTRSRDFVGFGSLRKLSGAAESLTFNPEEKDMLFSFAGSGKDSTTTKLISSGGTLTVRGTSGDPLLTFAEQPTVEVDITGDSYDLRAHAYQGSGTINNLHSADESYARDDYKGSGNIFISGIALVQVQLFQPPHTQVWII